jgi:shikimate dehydrogenase
MRAAPERGGTAEIESMLAGLPASAPMPERTGRPPAVLAGLIGRGIGLSRTPFMHEEEGRAQGFPYVYRLVDFDRTTGAPPSLGDVLRFGELTGFSGFNVTYPFKQEVAPLLDALAPEARRLGSVNTVVLEAGRRVGHNTDLFGFRESFLAEMAGAPRDRVLLLGAGGAGVAVAHGLLEAGVGELVLADLDTARAAALLERLGASFPGRSVRLAGDIAEAMEAAEGIVNATPVGMAKLPGAPIPLGLLRSEHWVADVIYFPLETELLGHAAALGCRTMNGSGMAVLQAVRAFELFSGRPADAARMRRAFAAFDDGERR